MCVDKTRSEQMNIIEDQKDTELGRATIVPNMNETCRSVNLCYVLYRYFWGDSTEMSRCPWRILMIDLVALLESGS